jgi:DNA-binding response OmpR family regulator
MLTKPLELKKVLLVDDDLDLLMLLERKLVQEGYIVETAASVPEAEDILSHFLPHLVLSDVNINGDDGRQLCFKLKNHQAHPPMKVILMSGVFVDSRLAHLFGADEMVAKPFSTDYLLNRMSYHLFCENSFHG